VLESPALARNLAQAGRETYESTFAPEPVLRAWQDFLSTVEN
jgi:hypothetical protein